MSSLYDQDQKKVQKLELHLSYTTCDEMIKIPPTERGLIFMTLTNEYYGWYFEWKVSTKVSFADLHSYQKQLQTIQTFKTEAIII